MLTEKFIKEIDFIDEKRFVMEKQAKLWLTIGIVAIIVIGLIILFSASKQEEAIKIGVVLPLSGEAASWGQNGLAGMELALKEINEKGGVNGRKLKLVTEDSKCSSSSVSAVQKLVNIDKVDGIVGFVCSSAAGPALPITKKENTPVVMIGASAPNLTEIGKNIFRIYPSDNAQGKFAADFIFNKLQKKKVAIIYVKNDWGEGLKRIFVDRFETLGGEVVYSGGILQTEKDLRTEIQKIKDSGAEALYLPVYPANAIAALKQIKELNLSLSIIGGDTFDSNEVIGSGYADGVIYTVGKINLPEGFKPKINSLKGFESLSVNIVAPLGYDGIKTMYTAIRNAGSTDKLKVINALAKLSYEGISSPKIEFDEKGNLKTPVFEVKEIENKKSIPYKG